MDVETQTLCHGLLDIIKALQPHSTTTSTRSHSAQPLLRNLRTKLGNQDDVLPLGEEHDAAEGLELLLQALSSEIFAAFHSHAQKPLQMKAALQALINPEYYFSPSSSSDACLTGWKSIRLPCEGLLATRMQCVKCQHHFDTQYTKFTTLSMPLPTTASSTTRTSTAGAAVATGNMLGIARVPPNCSLIPCFDALFGYELVSGVHCRGCSIRASLKQVPNLPVKTKSETSPSSPPPPQSKTGGTTNKIKKKQASIFTKLVELQQCVDERRPLPSESSIQSLFQAAKMPYLHQTQTHVTRQSVVVRWPPVLVLHLRRSIWTPDGRLMKVVGNVKFPLALRLEAKDEQKVNYQLQSVVHHTGLSAGTGHYVTFRKVRIDQNVGTTVPIGMGSDDGSRKVQECGTRWVRVSDEAVKVVDEKEVLAADAILLLYEVF